MSWQERVRGAAIIELGAALALLMPMIMLLLVLFSQCGIAFGIRGVVGQAAHRAARQLAIEYWRDPQIKDNLVAQEALVFDNIRIPGMIVSSDQFTAAFSTSTAPKYVAVTVKFRGGSYGLPPFPSPDLLHTGSWTISETAAQWVE